MPRSAVYAPRILPNALAALALTALCACTIDHAVDATDKHLFVVGRTELPIGEGEDGGENGRTTVEFAGSWFDGDARVGDPAGAELHYRNSEVSCAVRYSLTRGSLDFGVLAGLVTDAMSLETRPNAGVPRERDHQFWLGPMLGVEAGWDASSRIRLYGRVAGAAMLPSANSISTEAGVGFRVVDELELLLGYRHWNLRGDTDTLLTGFDAIDLTVDGVFLGGALRF